MSDASHEEQSSLVTSPKDTDSEPIKGKKIFFASTGNEETFIDHDCTLDDEGYPLYPNCRTIFVKTPEMTIQNFGLVGFPKTSNVEWQANKSWKMTQIFCLGAMLCRIPSAPAQLGNALEKWHTRHARTLYTITWFDKNQQTKWAILRHHGTHNHPWPAPKKPDPLSKLKLKREVMKNPSAGAFKLKLGKPTAPLNPFESVTKIHEAFVNSDCLQYHRCRILTDLGINPEKVAAGLGDKFLHDMFQWNQ
ncbi:uncharacterized protein PGTG_22351 [Puccinia graminis f. sp. tritici CRL 75-36-700-3]|uniref:Uncharacterized protein n=1 Tax=Puccinia graminis f. sp. tritici (strain CRL 75-36-700-3 / race SCCL) TaxID=418459 RepID=H6QU57_PUCGT|nr:uncharacterized protein PGTG_22351 [Puccinia graminis f. sp. tritici CRL 75-36-700-3]EHS64471.1 hypothetical protein PGTG_22351 [Puccinia graminis f. sp. tritici CRL 75-36-700-3]